MVTGSIFAKWAFVAVVMVVLGAVAPSSGTGIRLPFRSPHTPVYEFIPDGPEGEFYFPLSSNYTVCVGNVVYNAKQYFSYSYWVKPDCPGFSPPTCDAKVINLNDGDIPESVSIEMPTEDGNWTEVVAILEGRDDYKAGRHNKYVLAFCCEPNDEEPVYLFRRTSYVSRGGSPSFDVLAECECECEDCHCGVESHQEPLHMTVDYDSGRRRGEPRHLKDRVFLVPTVVPVVPAKKRSRKE